MYLVEMWLVGGRQCKQLMALRHWLGICSRDCAQAIMYDQSHWPNHGSYHYCQQ
jgi:hypothetical protein